MIKYIAFFTKHVHFATLVKTVVHNILKENRIAVKTPNSQFSI